EALRTIFKAEQGEPLQVVQAYRRQRLGLVDLSRLAAGDQPEVVKRLVQEEGRRSFDLGSGPLLREVLLRVGEAQHVLVLTMHHIVSDGWSSGVLYEEIAKLYGWLREGKRSGLAELAIQYGDFSQWQQQWLQGERLQRQLKYWRQQLQGAPEILELLTDKPRQA